MFVLGVGFFLLGAFLNFWDQSRFGRQIPQRAPGRVVLFCPPPHALSNSLGLPASSALKSEPRFRLHGSFPLGRGSGHWGSREGSERACRGKQGAAWGRLRPRTPPLPPRRRHGRVAKLLRLPGRGLRENRAYPLPPAPPSPGSPVSPLTCPPGSHLRRRAEGRRGGARTVQLPAPAPLLSCSRLTPAAARSGRGRLLHFLRCLAGGQRLRPRRWALGGRGGSGSEGPGGEGRGGGGARPGHLWRRRLRHRSQPHLGRLEPT